jgi:hypothetical protein
LNAWAISMPMGPAPSTIMLPGSVIERENLTVGNIVDLLQPRYGGNGRRRSGGNDPGLGRDGPAIQIHGVVILEKDGPEDHLRSQFAEAFFGIMLLDDGDHILDPPGDP